MLAERNIPLKCQFYKCNTSPKGFSCSNPPETTTNTKIKVLLMSKD